MASCWLHIIPKAARRHVEGRTYLWRVVRNAGWVTLERALRYLLGFVVGVWIARYVGSEQYGLLNYALSLVTILAFLGTLGLDGVAVRDLVREPESRDSIIGTLLSLRIAGAVLLVIITGVAAAVLHPSDPRILSLVLPIALAHCLLAFETIDCWFQSIVSSRYTVAARIAAVVIMSAIRIVLILKHAPLVAFAWAILAEAGLFAAALLVAYRRSGQVISRLRPTLARARSLVVDGWPAIASAVVATFYLRIDQVMLGWMAGFEQVGNYALGVRVLEVTNVLPVVLTTSLYPAMIKSKSLGAAILDARMQRFFDLVIWLAIVIAIPLSYLAPALVHVVAGAGYAGAGPVLSVLAWMPILTFFAIARQRWLYAENALTAALAVEFAGCALNVVANLLLIPRFGAVGAALASIIAAAAATLLLAIVSRKIRRSLVMFLRALLAPVLLGRGLLVHR